MATFIANGPDGTLWFTQPNGKIGKLTTSGDVKEFVFSDPYSKPK
jgi:streptogramin lyase